jgi:hypothetical protein
MDQDPESRHAPPAGDFGGRNRKHRFHRSKSRASYLFVIRLLHWPFVAGLVILVACSSEAGAASLGGFEEHSDVGAPKRGGAAEFDAARRSYRLTGGGKNMWFANDALHFVWKKVSGDVTLAADIAFEGQGGDPHRKACLLIRQSLDDDSAYADAALHGDGLTSLQYREAKGALTREIQSNVAGPQRLRIEKRGMYVSMSIAPAGEALRPAGGSFRLALKEPFYVGIGVCAHNDDALETAVFANVELTEGSSPPRRSHRSSARSRRSRSRPRIGASCGGPGVDRSAELAARRNQSSFQQQRAHLPHAFAGGEPVLIDSGFATRCNNDHGISPDGTQLVISDQSQDDKRSRIYTLPHGGRHAEARHQSGTIVWHGWSPDGKTLAYCAERNGEFDIYTIPVNGGN